MNRSGQKVLLRAGPASWAPTSRPCPRLGRSELIGAYPESSFFVRRNTVSGPIRTTTEDFVTPSTFASAGPLDIRKGRSGSDLSQQRSRAATGRHGIARGAWGSPVILISIPLLVLHRRVRAVDVARTRLMHAGPRGSARLSGLQPLARCPRLGRSELIGTYPESSFFVRRNTVSSAQPTRQPPVPDVAKRAARNPWLPSLNSHCSVQPRRQILSASLRTRLAQTCLTS